MGNDTYGVVLFKVTGSLTDPHKIQMLLVKRRCSYAFCDFVDGIYNSKAADFSDQMKHRLKCMTSEEKTYIYSLNFEQMYFKSHINLPPKIVSTVDECEKYETRFNKFYNTFIRDDNGAKLQGWIKDVSHLHFFQLCEFPKGRAMNNHEKPIVSATREMYEETNISSAHYGILNPSSPFMHVYTGSDDHKQYRCQYFFGRVNADENRLCTNITHSPNQHSQRFEIDDIFWLPLSIVVSEMPRYKPICDQIMQLLTNEAMELPHEKGHP